MKKSIILVVLAALMFVAGCRASGAAAVDGSYHAPQHTQAVK